mgnify:CR=1 FL=1
MANEEKSAVELSKEELDQRRREIKSYYEENIPSLKVQLEYEELLRDIEKSRGERLRAQMFVAQTMAQAPKDDDDVPGAPQAGEVVNLKGAEDARAAGKAKAQAIKAQMAAQAQDSIKDSKRTLKRAK